jgi:N-acetyl-anhydromuramyl-L-alanine amidase AmpD
MLVKPFRFVPAKNFTLVDAARPRTIKHLVLHSMEAQEKAGVAYRVALYFAEKNAPQASAHYCIDSAEIVQSVADKDVAWHAPGCNQTGIGIEHAGFAKQTAEQWMDPYSKAMLKLSVELAADLCKRHGIPPVALDASALREGKAGITTHAAVSEAFKRSTHWDPGPGFPLKWYVKAVAELLGKGGVA